MKKVSEYKPMPSEKDGDTADNSPMKKQKKSLENKARKASTKKRTFSTLNKYIEGLEGLVDISNNENLDEVKEEEEKLSVSDKSDDHEEIVIAPKPKVEIKDEVILEGRKPEEEEDEEENQRNKLIIELEKWLVEDDIPLIGKKEFISNVFKKIENFEILVTFILDPMYFNFTNLVN